MEPCPAASSPDGELPPGYVKRHDALTGYDFFVNLHTGSSQWTFPRTSAYLASPLDASHPDTFNPDLVPPPHGYRQTPANGEAPHMSPPPPEKHVQLRMSGYTDPGLWSHTSSSAHVNPQIPPWAHTAPAPHPRAQQRASRQAAPNNSGAAQPPLPAAVHPTHQSRSSHSTSGQQTTGSGRHVARRASSLCGRQRASSLHGHMPASLRPQSVDEHSQIRKKRGFIRRHPGIAVLLAGGLAAFGLSLYLGGSSDSE
ncbi:hypothetical protein H4R19_001433 [Coemansia spiralis]|nr:hypothetical protein H4R19_001433 [Coemansia spiralis]